LIEMDVDSFEHFVEMKNLVVEIATFAQMMN
jgi:hypothetical protein